MFNHLPGGGNSTTAPTYLSPFFRALHLFRQSLKYLSSDGGTQVYGVQSRQRLSLETGFRFARERHGERSIDWRVVRAGQRGQTVDGVRLALSVYGVGVLPALCAALYARRSFTSPSVACLRCAFFLTLSFP